MNRKKRLNHDKGYKSYKCIACKFYYKELNYGQFCTPECALGHNNSSPEVYNAYCALFSSDPSLPKDYQPAGAPRRNSEESYDSYWTRVIKAIYVHPQSVGAMTLKKLLKASIHIDHESYSYKNVNSMGDDNKINNNNNDSRNDTSCSTSSSSSKTNNKISMIDDFSNASPFFLNFTSAALTKKQKIK